MRYVRKILTNAIREVIVLLGTQESDDALYECHRLYIGEREMVIDDADVNVILAYPDEIILQANEGRTTIYASSMTDIELQTFYQRCLWRVVVSSQELMDYIDTLGYTRESILRGARRDGEKPMGYLLSSLRDHTGLPKRWLCTAAANLLDKFNVRNE